jgi:hypothetical protein
MPRIDEARTLSNRDNPKGFNASTLAIIEFLEGNLHNGMCRCPCHEDNTPSLQVSNGRKWATVVHCFGKDSREHDREVIQHLRNKGMWLSPKRLEAAEAKQRTPKERLQYAERVWKGVRDNSGEEMAELLLKNYLRPRAIKKIPSTAMLSLPVAYGKKEIVIMSDHPGMMLPIYNHEGRFRGFQVTWLNGYLDAKREQEPQRQTYGLLRGNFVVPELQVFGERPRKLLIAEGSETVLAGMQLSGELGIAAAGKFAGLVPLESDEYIILVDLDRDGGSRKNAGILAQRLSENATVRLALPPRPDNAKHGYDWNDALIDAADDNEQKRELKELILNAPEFSEAMTDEEKYRQAIDELAHLDGFAFDQKRTAIKDEFGVRYPTIDKGVEGLRQQRLAEAADGLIENVEAIREELAEAAKEIIESEDVLEAFLEDSDRGIAGEDTLRQVLYLAGTSRLFDKPMSMAIKGESSSGKSATRDFVLNNYMPDEDVIQFTTLSEKALYYFEGGLSHKILSMGEAGNPEEKTLQDMIIRQLMSEGVLRYPVVQKQPDGTYKTVVIVKEGPVCFIVTTTHNKLHPENETRMLSIEADDSAKQTKRVLSKIALTQGMNRPNASPNADTWQAFQRWLAIGDTDVVVPFASVLAKKIGTMSSVRLRRDFTQLLCAIKAHALLHRAHRRSNKDGEIIATITKDYAAVATLMGDLMATSAEIKVRKTVTETVEAVETLLSRPELARSGGVTVQHIKTKLKLNQSSASRRLRQATTAGLLRNTEERKGYPARYELTGERAPSAIVLLPSVDKLREAYNATLKTKSSVNQLRKQRKVNE